VSSKLELPDQLYFKIGEVARLLDVPPHVLRYWEDELPRLRPHKSRGGQRLYRRADIELLIRIKTLTRDEGFTIAGARRELARQQTSRRASDDDAGAVRPGHEGSDIAGVAALREEVDRLKAERIILASARATATRRLEEQRQALFGLRAEVVALLESLDQRKT
jgi:DNA-binding transcriptional MerR regulator